MFIVGCGCELLEERLIELEIFFFEMFVAATVAVVVSDVCPCVY